MRRTVVSLALAALVGAGTTATANADTPRCVSRHEYDRVTTGMRMTKVHKIFDIRGTETGLGAPNTLRYYRTCTGRGVVQVVFNPKGRVVSKAGRIF